MKYNLVEIFTSIQGEGVNLGKSANFIRFAGCNLKCPWCDTIWNKTNEVLTKEQIEEKLDKSVKLVVLTGGEPTIQKNLPELIDYLTHLGYQITMETNGTNRTDIYEHVFITCSPKPQTNWSVNDNCQFDEIKYVVDDKLSVNNIIQTSTPIWLQPEGSDMQNAWKKALKIQKQYLTKYPNADIRIGVQLHKIIDVR